jgi:hypothetical protein
MFLAVIVSLLIVAGVGASGYFILDRANHDKKLEQKEFLWITAGLVFICLPAFLYGGKELAIHSQVTFVENWGGFELKVLTETFQCHESSEQGGSTGGCSHYYDTDSYEHWVSEGHYEGDDKNRHWVDTSHNETRWRQLPYTDTETTWTIATTLGDYTVGNHWLPDHPELHRLGNRWGSYDSLDHSLSFGTPSSWTAAALRLQTGNPGPVTAQRDYPNYVLASQDSILKNNNDSIGRYLKASLMPALNSTLNGPYYLNRVYSVGVPLTGAWENAVDWFDAAFGAQMQGDLQIVIVNANEVTDPDNYHGALVAYWESPAFKKNALSKNSVLLTIGTTDGKTIAWVRAATGMPMGNEGLLLQLQNDLKGQPLDPVVLLGHPHATLSAAQDSVTVTMGDGVVAKILTGENKFVRVRMDSHDKNSPGFEYLLREIEPTYWQWVGIIFGVFAFSCLVWGIAIFQGVPRLREMIANLASRR